MNTSTGQIIECLLISQRAPESDAPGLFSDFAQGWLAGSNNLHSEIEDELLGRALHTASHAVDEFVGLDAILRPGIEGQLLLALLPGARDGHKVFALAAAYRDLVGDALFREAKVQPGLLKRRIDDRVGDYDSFDLHDLTQLYPTTALAQTNAAPLPPPQPVPVGEKRRACPERTCPVLLAR